MRKKIAACIGLIKNIAACVGLIALVVAAALAFDARGPEAPLRVGMTGDELDSAFGEPTYAHWCQTTTGRHLGDKGEALAYKFQPDWLGNARYVRVFLNDEGVVVSWEIRTLPDSRSYSDKVKYVMRRK